MVSFKKKTERFYIKIFTEVLSDRQVMVNLSECMYMCDKYDCFFYVKKVLLMQV